MTAPTKVTEFHADYERQIGDRSSLFGALAASLSDARTVLYPGSYVDLSPSDWFDDVTYVDTDRRANRFFGEQDAVHHLIAARRRSAGASLSSTPTVSFLHHDYRTDLPLADGSMDVLVSLYAGFISEHCTRYLKRGGALLVNSSHGDAAMASIDSRYRLSGVVLSRSGGYALSEQALDTYLVPKRPRTITVETLHESGKGIGYKRSAFAYVFTREA